MSSVTAPAPRLCRLRPGSVVTAVRFSRFVGIGSAATAAPGPGVELVAVEADEDTGASVRNFPHFRPLLDRTDLDPEEVRSLLGCHEAADRLLLLPLAEFVALHVLL